MKRIIFLIVTVTSISLSAQVNADMGRVSHILDMDVTTDIEL
jgi:hypothetical protein